MQLACRMMSPGNVSLKEAEKLDLRWLDLDRLLTTTITYSTIMDTGSGSESQIAEHGTGIFWPVKTW